MTQGLNPHLLCLLYWQVDSLSLGHLGNHLCVYINTYILWQEYTEELYKKELHDSDNHNGVITHLEPDILECKVKWALGSSTTNKASGDDGIPVELFQILKGDAVRCCTQHMEKQTVSKLGKAYVKAVYCQPAYLTFMQSTLCKMPDCIKNNLESRLQGENSVISDMQMIPPLWKKTKN